MYFIIVAKDSLEKETKHALTPWTWVTLDNSPVYNQS